MSSAAVHAALVVASRHAAQAATDLVSRHAAKTAKADPEKVPWRHDGFA